MSILEPKRKKFCDEYLIDFNATQAAIRAGYSKKTARSQGDRLLTNADIQKYLQARISKISEKLEITQERVMQEYARIAFADIRKLYKETGELKPIHELDDDTAACISGVEVDELFEYVDGQRNQIGVTKKIKRWDKKGALDSICKVMGFNAPDKTDVTTKGESLNKENLSRLSNDELMTLLKLKRKMSGAE